MALRTARTRLGRFRRVLRSASRLKKRRLPQRQQPASNGHFQILSGTVDEEETMLQEYERWLRDHGVWWSDAIRLRPPVPSAAPGSMESGWGLRSLKTIEEGTVLIRVPRSAIVSAANVSVREGSATGQPDPITVQALLEQQGILKKGRKFDPDIDTQLPQALALILARKQASWRAKLRPEVTPTSCGLPWALRGASPKYLKGTDVEAPVNLKKARLRQEFSSFKNLPELEGVSEDEYIDACAVILSRVQPWWSGCLVPFVDHINHKWGLPDVEFLKKGDTIVGTSLGRIQVGEVYQSYGEISTADSVYRYGFAPLAPKSDEIRPLPGDCVTITLADLKEAYRRNFGEGAEALAARLRLLTVAEVLEESPWDGSSELGIELTYGKETGTVALLLASTILTASASELPRTVEAVPKEESAAVALLRDFLMDRVSRQDPSGKLLEEFQAARKKRRKRSESWMDSLPLPSSWAGPTAAVDLALETLALRSRRYEGSEKTLAMDEADFDRCFFRRGGLSEEEKVPPSSQEPAALELALLQLRILERRLLASTSESIATLFQATSTS